MPVILQGDTISVQLIGYQFGQTVMLTHHYKATYNAGESMDWLVALSGLNGLLNEVGSLYQRYKDCTHETLTNIKAWLQVISPVRLRRLNYENDSDTGGLAGEPLPQNVSASITMQSDFSGRGEIGVKHIGAVPADGVVEGVITPAQHALYAALGGQLVEVRNVVDGEIDLDFVPIIFRRTSPLTSPVVTGFNVNDTSRVMRRRTVGLGI